jgi:hypothetical protein
MEVEVVAIFMLLKGGVMGGCLLQATPSWTVEVMWVEWEVISRGEAEEGAGRWVLSQRFD